MTSVLLKAAARHLMLLQIVLSLFLLVRGHNLPGGGFIGGLLGASAFILYALGFGVARARAVLYVRPRTLMAGGLLIASLSGVIALATQNPYMTGKWLGEIWLPVIGKVGIGTPFLFDVGVYFVVFGMTVQVIFSLLSEAASGDTAKDGTEDELT